MREVIRIAVGVAGGMLLWEIIKALLPIAGTLFLGIGTGVSTFSPRDLPDELAIGVLVVIAVLVAVILRRYARDDQ